MPPKSKSAKPAYKRKGKRGVAAIAKRVKTLEKTLKPEKKHIIFTPGGETGNQFAQQNTLAYTAPGGMLALDLTAQLAVGTLVTDRIGNKVNPTGCMIDFLVQGDVNLVNKLQYKVHFVRVPDNTYNASVSTMAQHLLEKNPFSPSGTAIDWHSRRDLEFMRQYQIMKTVSGVLYPDQLVGQTAMSQRKVALRLPSNFLWSYNNTINETTTDRLFCIVVADSGVISLNTGGIFKCSIKWFYYDQ